MGDLDSRLEPHFVPRCMQPGMLDDGAIGKLALLNQSLHPRYVLSQERLRIQVRERSYVAVAGLWLMAQHELVRRRAVDAT